MSLIVPCFKPTPAIHASQNNTFTSFPKIRGFQCNLTINIFQNLKSLNFQQCSRWQSSALPSNVCWKRRGKFDVHFTPGSSFDHIFRGPHTHQNDTYTNQSNLEDFKKKNHKELSLAIEKGEYDQLANIFIDAVFMGRTKIARYLIDSAGFDINASYPFLLNGVDSTKDKINAERITPAYLTVLKNDPENLKKLISLGANCNTSNQNNLDSPLLCSIRRGSNCFDVLMETKNIDLNFCDELGRTPLMIAILFGKPEMAQLLVECGADINRVAQFGESALTFTVASGDVSSLEFLLSQGANPRILDQHKNNLWHYAAQSVNPEKIMDVLRDHIEDLIDSKNYSRKSPLFMAVNFARPKAVESLIGNGASLTQTANRLYKCTPIEPVFEKIEEISIYEYAKCYQQELINTLETDKINHSHSPPERIKIWHTYMMMKEVIAVLENPPGVHISRRTINAIHNQLYEAEKSGFYY